MQAMHADLKDMPHIRAMHGGTGRAMGMWDGMRALMRQYREQQRSDCPAGRPTTPHTGGR